MTAKTLNTAHRLRRILALGLCGTLTALPALALVPEFGVTATPGGERREAVSSYAVPTGPWRAGAIPTVTAEGAVSQTAWKLDAPGKSTLELLQPLREQARAAGYETVFECDAASCGGFDFRYGTDILPEPGMHVDLGDYRFLAARRNGADGDEWLTLVVSRSADTGFVQMTLVGAAPEAVPDLSVSTKSLDEDAPLETGSIAAQGIALDAGKPLVLQGLAFPSGKAELAAGDYASLHDLADWLAANPQARVELVGHTDGSGDPDANTALSLARADAVRAALAGLGADTARIGTRGAGPAEPVASNDTPEGRAQNRRVEVVLTPTL